MTNTDHSTAEDRVVVEQIDRDFAANLIEAIAPKLAFSDPWLLSAETWRRGHRGHIEHVFVPEMFARHRLAPLAQTPERAGAVREVADQLATVEAHEHDDQRELSLLYNHRADDSLQFNRGHMRMAIYHGRRLGSTAAFIANGGRTLKEAITTLDVFLAAYMREDDDALVNRVEDDDLLTWGHLRAILAATTPVPAISEGDAKC